MQNFDRFLDVCRVVHEARSEGMDFETSASTDVEAFVTLYLFKELDSDGGGAIAFG